VLPTVLLVALVLMIPASAGAAEPTSGYGSTPTTPTTTPATTPATTPTPTTPTTPTTPSEPKTGTSPSTEKGTPAGKEEPAKTSTTPTAKAATLPFTGFDLRWTVAIGLLLMSSGFTIVVIQRRHQRNSSR
jgi:uncharacterized membrane protein